MREDEIEVKEQVEEEEPAYETMRIEKIIRKDRVEIPPMKVGCILQPSIVLMDDGQYYMLLNDVPICCCADPMLIMHDYDNLCLSVNYLKAFTEYTNNDEEIINLCSEKS